ncbi:MAG: four helix bundle protein [Crocinitomicaceae bacterium]
MQTYTNIQAQGVKLSEMVFHLTEKFPKYGEKGLTEMLRKTSFKLVGNIEEGCGNPHSVEAMHFFKRSIGEINKLREHIRRAKECGCMGMVGFELVLLNVERFEQSLAAYAAYHKRKLSV